MRLKALLLALPLLLAALFCGCARKGFEYRNTGLINVTVADGEQYYLRKNTYEIERGADLTVTLVFKDGYIPDGCSYEDYQLFKVSPDEYSLTLYNIRYPEFVRVGEANKNEAIRYYANGGEYIGEKPVEGYIKGEISKTHIRTNTDLGFGMLRRGYVLTGWNTESDGSGTHVGLRAGFCEGLNADEVVIPRTVEAVEAGAFKSCSVKNLCFFDTLISLSDESFENCDIEGVSINAAGYPRYQSETEIAYFADAIDRLITLKDKKS